MPGRPRQRAGMWSSMRSHCATFSGPAASVSLTAERGLAIIESSQPRAIRLG